MLWGEVEQTAPELDAASLTVFVEARVESPAELGAEVPLGAEARVAIMASDEPPTCRDAPAVAAW